MNPPSISERKTTPSSSSTTIPVKPSQDVIPPGGEASIRARLNLRGRHGFQRKTITVKSNDPNTPNLILTLTGTAIQPLRATLQPVLRPCGQRCRPDPDL